MATGTAERPSAAELKAAKKEREAAEKAKRDKAIAEAQNALGTGTVDGIDNAPQEPYEGDETDSEQPAQENAQLSFSVGGKKPTTTSVRLTGGKVNIPGSYAKGSKLVLHLEVRVGEVAFVDEHDPKTNQIIGCERRHKARVLNARVL